jgi:hypothetical protein
MKTATNRTPSSTRAEMRYLAIAVSVMNWAMGTVMLVQSQRQAFARPALPAGISALGGLLAWAVYHAVSRRNDGLIIVMGGLATTMGLRDLLALPLGQQLSMQVRLIAVWVCLSVVFGLLARKLYGAHVQAPASALREAEDAPRCPH